MTNDPKVDDAKITAITGGTFEPTLFQFSLVHKDINIRILVYNLTCYLYV